MGRLPIAAPEQSESLLSVTEEALARVRGYRADGEAMWGEAAPAPPIPVDTPVARS